MENDDEVKTEQLALDPVYDEEGLEQQYKDLKPVLEDYVKAGTEAETPVEEWLPEKLKADLPDKSEEEIHQMSDEIIATVRINDEKRESLGKAMSQGRSRESWFARECQNATSGMTAQEAGKYLQTIDDTLVHANNEMTNTILTKEGVISQNPRLHGFIAEEYHAQSFNKNAAVQGSSYHAEVLKPEGTTYGKNSVDIVIKDANGKIVRKYQAKYYDSASGTAEAFKKGNYSYQRKLVPSDQAGDLPNATDHIESPDGVKSDPLSYDQAKKIQEDAQISGDWDQWDWNSLNSKQLAKGIGTHVAAAGIAGAAAGVGFDIVDKAVHGEKIDAREEVKVALKSGGDFAVKTGTAAAIKVASEKGVLTIIPKGTPMSTITNIACVGVETAKTFVKVSNGKYTLRQGLDEIETTAVSTTAGLMVMSDGATVGGAIGALLGPVGMVIGGFVGGTVGYIGGSKIGKAVTKVAHAVRDAYVKSVRAVGKGIHRAFSKVKRSLFA